ASPGLNPETSAPIASTIPDSSEPRIRGKGWSSTLPSRMRASQWPTPAAFTRTSSCPAAGSGSGRSSYVITLRGPNRRTRAAFIYPPLNAFRVVGCVSMSELQATEKLRVECHNNRGEAHRHRAQAHGEIDSPVDKDPSSHGNGNQVIGSRPE